MLSSVTVLNFWVVLSHNSYIELIIIIQFQVVRRPESQHESA